MSFAPEISAAARRFLAEKGSTRLERTAANLPALRGQTKADILPLAEESVQRHRVSISDTVVAGIPCLTVSPPERLRSWKLLYVFGGGFVQGSPREELTIVAPLCAALGVEVLLPEYRLAPEHPWPAAFNDVSAVYEAFCQQPFALMGESAGGNLALTLLLHAQDNGLPLPEAMVLLSPASDLTGAGDSLASNDGRDPTLGLSDVKNCTKHYAHGQDLTQPLISPVYGHYGQEVPPCLITTGTRDLLLSLAVRTAQVLRAAGGKVDLQVWEEMWHVFEWDPNLPEAEQSLDGIAQFLRKTVGA